MTTRLFALVIVCALCVTCDKKSPTAPNTGGSNPTSPSNSCAYTVTPTSISHQNTVSTGNITITTASNCNWTATTNVLWFQFALASSGTGNALIPYRLDSNPGNTTRTTVITVAGRFITVTQAGAPFLEVKGNYTFTMQVSPRCYPWENHYFNEQTGYVETQYLHRDWPTELRAWSGPVSVRVKSYVNGYTSGVLSGFPLTREGGSGEGLIDVDTFSSGFSTPMFQGPGRTSVSNGYVFKMVEGGASTGPTRAPDGRGEILNGMVHEVWGMRYENLGAPFAPCPFGGCIVSQWGCLWSDDSAWSLKAR